MIGVLKSILGGSSKIYAGLYDGTPVQIYPTEGAFNWLISDQIYVSHNSDTTTTFNLSDYMDNLPDNILYIFAVLVKVVATVSRTYTVSLISWTQTNVTFGGGGLGYYELFIIY